MKLATTLSLIAVLAACISVPALAQTPNAVQEGDYYSPGTTVVQQPTSQELNQAKEGDYYAPSKTTVQQPTSQQLNKLREGDYYAPTQGDE